MGGGLKPGESATCAQVIKCLMVENDKAVAVRAMTLSLSQFLQAAYQGALGPCRRSLSASSVRVRDSRNSSLCRLRVRDAFREETADRGQPAPGVFLPEMAMWRI